MWKDIRMWLGGGKRISGTIERDKIRSAWRCWGISVMIVMIIKAIGG